MLPSIAAFKTFSPMSYCHGNSIKEQKVYDSKLLGEDEVKGKCIDKMEVVKNHACCPEHLERRAK